MKAKTILKERRILVADTRVSSVSSFKEFILCVCVKIATEMDCRLKPESSLSPSSSFELEIILFSAVSGCVSSSDHQSNQLWTFLGSVGWLGDVTRTDQALTTSDPHNDAGRDRAELLSQDR